MIKRKYVHAAKIPLIAIFLLLLSIGFTLSVSRSIQNTHSKAAGESAAVTINVTNTLQTGTTGGSRLGINTDYWWDGNSNRSSGARSLSTALKDMGAKYWRYPGGEKADGYLWSTPPYTASNPRLARISSSDWPSNDTKYWSPAGTTAGNWTHDMYDFDEFMSDCKIANCTPVIVVAYDGIYKPAGSGGVSLTRQQALDTAVAWVNYANKVKGYGIKYWEIGNETWLPGYMGGDPGRITQANDFKEFCSRLKAVDPTIWCGISANTQADWNTLLSNAAADIDFLSVHSYEGYNFTFSTYQSNVINATNQVDYAYNALQSYQEHKGRIKIMVTETGGATFGSWNQADTGHALMTFDMLAQFQQDKRVEFTQFWNTRFIKQNEGGNGWPYAESEFDALKPDNSFSPQGMAIKLLSQYSLINMVGTTSTPSVRTFASYDPTSKKLNIWLINKSSSAMPTTVSLQNYTSGTGATVSVFKGSSSTDLYPAVSLLPTVPVLNNQMTLTLSPISITVLQLTPGTTYPTTAPSATTIPTLTSPPGTTILSFDVKLHGIGNGGDNKSETSVGNMNPLTKQRDMIVELYNANNKLVTKGNMRITYQPSTGTYVGTFNAGLVPTGVYTVYAHTKKYLRTQIPGFRRIVGGTPNVMPQFAVIVGDANLDNSLSILDYNILMDCYTDLTYAKNCSDTNKRGNADLDDDGRVNATDYNLFIREISVYQGA